MAKNIVELKENQLSEAWRRDPNMRTVYWKNESSQTHYFENLLPGVGPKIITVKPSYLTILPHRYYRVSTHDSSPVKGRWIFPESIQEVREDIAPKD